MIVEPTDEELELCKAILASISEYLARTGIESWSTEYGENWIRTSYRYIGCILDKAEIWICYYDHRVKAKVSMADPELYEKIHRYATWSG